MQNNKFVEKGLKNTKSLAVKAAKDLFYGDDVVKALENATTVGEIDHIMVTARNKNRVGYSEY